MVVSISSEVKVEGKFIAGIEKSEIGVREGEGLICSPLLMRIKNTNEICAVIIY